MDPLLFGINSDVVFEALSAIVLLALIIERGLSIVFGHRLYVDYLAESGWKEPIAFLVSWGVVAHIGFDAIAIIFSKEENSLIGYLVTAGVIAGGSKGSIALFATWLDWRSSAEKKSKPKPKVSGK